MKHKFSTNLVWTDGGNPHSTGYFDGAGDFSAVLKSMFAGSEYWNIASKLPCNVSIMERVPFGTPVKVTVILEVKDAAL